ncbi:hypothetical protein [Rhizomicrobium electricum]|jgi:hypothetical protein|uniref:Uncharacterized protein n=1 Tax=Rhizomicrobium electricum TaxID=480070 RepID=A0ABN1F118_9PROT|nr:hypothetical protein [Rhizomicrobium electricum]NIJ50244.1 hypothetical protein [Rhizomicrobium electricum]
MRQTTSKRKPATKGRTAALRRRPAAPSTKTDKSEAALATLLALLHADRWLFEATELAKKGQLTAETKEFNRIRLSIVASLNRLQPRAYGAMTRSGHLAGGY